MDLDLSYLPRSEGLASKSPDVVTHLHHTFGPPSKRQGEGQGLQEWGLLYTLLFSNTVSAPVWES